MEKILVRVVSGLMQDGTRTDYNRREDLLVLSVEVGEPPADWVHPHQVDPYAEAVAVAARAFCLGDESGGRSGRPLDDITFPTPLVEVLRDLNFVGITLWQIAWLPTKEEVFDLLLRGGKRRGVGDALFAFLRRERQSIPNFLCEELVERIKSLCEPVK